MASETKWTPGPWRLDAIPQHEASIIGPDGKLVVAGEGDGYMCPFVCREDAEGAANAHLTASAPRLYAALEALLEKVHAVDKALQPLYALAHVHGWEYGGPIYEEELKDAAAALAQARGESDES